MHSEVISEDGDRAAMLLAKATNVIFVFRMHLSHVSLCISDVEKVFTAVMALLWILWAENNIFKVNHTNFQ